MLGRIGSASSADHGKKPGLSAHIRRDRSAFGECAAGSQHADLRFRDLAAGLGEVTIERGVLPGGRGQIPAVDQDVDEPVTGVHRPGHRPVRHRARRVQRPRAAESIRGSPGDAAQTAAGPALSTSPSSRSPTWSMVPPAPSSAARKLPDTRWLASPRTSHSEHWVAACQRSAGIPATTRPVASSARVCQSATVAMMSYFA
jgi:hypothetical protein